MTTTTTRFIRSEHRNRQTGTVVLVLDAQAADSDICAEDGLRWATLCDDHGGIVYHETLADARGWATEPLTWCPGCQEAGGR